MKILSLHCDYIKFKPLKKAIKEPEILSEKKQKEITVENPLVLMIAVEKHDENNPKFFSDLAKSLEGGIFK